MSLPNQSEGKEIAAFFQSFEKIFNCKLKKLSDMYRLHNTVIQYYQSLKRRVMKLVKFSAW